MNRGGWEGAGERKGSPGPSSPREGLPQRIRCLPPVGDAFVVGMRTEGVARCVSRS